MSTALFPEVLVSEIKDPKAGEPMIRLAGGLHDRRVIRRRGNREQGKALEFLGHSVEYLVDSRLFTKDEVEAQGDREAVQILMRASREVFNECAEVISLKRRLKRLGWTLIKRATGYDRRAEAPIAESGQELL